MKRKVGLGPRGGWFSGEFSLDSDQNKNNAVKGSQICKLVILKPECDIYWMFCTRYIKIILFLFSGGWFFGFLFILTKLLGKPSCEQKFNHYYDKNIIIICTRLYICCLHRSSVSVGIMRHNKCQRSWRLESSISQKEQLGCADEDVDWSQSRFMVWAFTSPLFREELDTLKAKCLCTQKCQFHAFLPIPEPWFATVPHPEQLFPETPRAGGVSLLRGQNPKI